MSSLHIKSGDAGVVHVDVQGAFTFSSGSHQEFDPEKEIPAGATRVVFNDAGIKEWDTYLLTLIMKAKAHCDAHKLELDISNLPVGVCRLFTLATAVGEREGARKTKKTESFLTRVGKSAISSAEDAKAMVAFLGEATISFGRFFTGKARYRKGEFWYIIQQCGPQALGIVTTVSVLVGAILAFVGAIQLKMFGAEIYVANLVGIGMVMEMGALMTGIILAGRSGASFAAQLGTMQVNEEIDALQTMGIPPMDYLVLPRMLALAVMTPLLVIYADILGIIGGAAVGVFYLKLPLSLFMTQTFEMMTLYFCAQGLIKGATFGVLIAIAGCMRGIQCGRSASAVGEAATSAVVSGIVLIVLADAMWTFIFMLTG